MKRYELITDRPVAIWPHETADGKWVKFTDHQAEIAKRDRLLRDCLKEALDDYQELASEIRAVLDCTKG